MITEVMKIESLQPLVKVARELLLNSMSENTKRAYMSDWRSFVMFCIENSLEPLPADTDTLVLWIADCKEKKKKTSSIVRSMTSINKIHLMLGHETTHRPTVREAMRGLKRTQGVAKEKTHAILWEELCLMIQGVWAFEETKSAIEKRDAAILSIGWSGALRRSEISELTFDDIDYSKKGVLLNIAKSKTDQFGEGYKIAIPFLDTRFCAATILKRWIDFLAGNGITAGFLFRSLGMSGRRYRPESIGGKIGDQSIGLIVKRYAKYIGKKKTDVSAHSLRRGFCTQAAMSGVPERLIMRHTRHQSVEVMREYIDSGNIWNESPLYAMYPSLNSVSGLLQKS